MIALLLSLWLHKNGSQEHGGECQAGVVGKRRGRMISTKKAARVAGLLYVSMSLLGVSCLLYIPSHFIVR